MVRSAMGFWEFPVRESQQEGARSKSIVVGFTVCWLVPLG